MIDIERLIKPPFIQIGNSCVLASYGIAARYFTKIPVERFFMSYCRHFDIPFTNQYDAQEKYNKHFHDCIAAARISGYTMIENLHNNSPQDAFMAARCFLNVENIIEIKPSMERIEETLKGKDALLNLTYIISGRGYHSITVGFYGSHFVYINTIPTTAPYFHSEKGQYGKVDHFNNFDDMSYPLQDGLLITSK